MITRVLVPLDGSALAQQALPMAAVIARKASAHVTLLHVLEAGAHTSVHGQRHLTNLQEASQYLQQMAAQYIDGGVAVDWHVHEQPTEHIALGLGGHAQEFGSDLIVMCAHGGVRLRDHLVGNLGQQLAHCQHAPILLLPGQVDRPAPVSFHLCLAPLDGEPSHERGLGVAAELSRMFEASMLLATVLSLHDEARKQLTTTNLLPGTTQGILEVRTQEAVEYLQRQVKALQEQGVPATAVVDPRGGPARRLVHLARERKADLVALTTHGRAGTEAFWSRSLPPRLLRRLECMFLLVPAE